MTESESSDPKPATASGAAGSSTTSACPWCSAELTGDPARCPSCGATLREGTEAEIPGVTQIDVLGRVARPTPRSRGLLGWLSGDYETEEPEGEIERASVEPPSTAVKREMLKLEMDALKAELDAEQAAQSEAALASAAGPVGEVPETEDSSQAAETPPPGGSAGGA